jgi:hypothetical protein
MVFARHALIVAAFVIKFLKKRAAPGFILKMIFDGRIF